MASPQTPTPTQDDSDQFLAQAFPRIDTLLQQLQQRIDARGVTVPESEELGIIDMMAEMQLQMEDMSRALAEQTAVIEALIDGKAEMIAIEEAIVRFLVGRSSISDFEENFEEDLEENLSIP